MKAMFALAVCNAAANAVGVCVRAENAMIANIGAGVVNATNAKGCRG